MVVSVCFCFGCDEIALLSGVDRIGSRAIERTVARRLKKVLKTGSESVTSAAKAAFKHDGYGTAEAVTFKQDRTLLAPSEATLTGKGKAETKATTGPSPARLCRFSSG